MAKKERLDKILTDKGLAESREKAKALIMAGKVFVDGRLVDKAGAKVSQDAKVEVRGELPYVSRGGKKLETALRAFEINPQGFVCLDVGASTGGFTDCLLKHGAKRVYAVDVGKGQLDWKLRNDERVFSMEGVNARYLTQDSLPEKVDLATIDVSFISLTKILPAVRKLLKDNGFIIALIKPQFELTKEEVSRGKGVVKEPLLHKKAIRKVIDFATENSLFAKKITLSRPLGPKGNKEFLVLFEKTPPTIVSDEEIERVVEEKI
jgi:23S rRNA (cytidine1920-2'-O)/16S rRNA (cytidine1409-2'-O)-methyltransferase